MNWFEWIVVCNFFVYVVYVYHVAKKNRRAGGN